MNIFFLLFRILLITGHGIGIGSNFKYPQKRCKLKEWRCCYNKILVGPIQTNFVVFVTASVAAAAVLFLEKKMQRGLFFFHRTNPT